MLSSLAHTAARALPAAIVLILVSPVGQAQSCLTPDNLNGPCWEFTDLNIPQFPGFGLPGKGICWENCDPQEDCVTVDFSPPMPTPTCGEYRSQVFVNDCAGVTLMRGTAVLNYTRNWEELNPVPGAPNIEVWRMLVKVDFEPTGTGVNLCPVPTCLGPTPSAFFYGYVDWARVCGTNQFQNATVLFHNCDYFIHQGNLSSRPGLFHPFTTYAVVAPSFASNPFTPVSQPLFSGPLVAEAVRNVTNPLGIFACQNEERIQQGTLDTLDDLCWCFNFNFAIDHNTLSHLEGIGSCNDPISGLPSLFASQVAFFPLLPWLEMVSTSIGCWDNDSSYPGKECVWVNEGLFQYFDSCAFVSTPAQAFPNSFEIMYGASTDGGYQVFNSPVSQPLTQKFVDLGDNWSIELGGPPPPPALFGSILGPTDHLIYVNVP